MKRPNKYYVPYNRAKWGFPEADRGAARLLSAEDAARRERYRFRGLTQLIEWVADKEIMDTDWFAEPFDDLVDTYDLEEELLIRGRSSDGGRCASFEIDSETNHATMWLPRWAWDEDIVLHEMAHVVTLLTSKHAHDDWYATNRLYAQREFGRPGSAERLEDEYVNYGVRYE